MALWQIRSGRSKEALDLTRSKGIIFVNWEVPDLSNVATIDEMRAIFRNAYNTSKDKTVLNWTYQMWSFVKEIELDDSVILPDKQSGMYRLGVVTGEYQYWKDGEIGALHIRSVDWSDAEIKRAEINPHILASLGSIMTVSHISRNNAEHYIKQLITKVNY